MDAMDYKTPKELAAEAAKEKDPKVPISSSIRKSFRDEVDLAAKEAGSMSRQWMIEQIVSDWVKWRLSQEKKKS